MVAAWASRVLERRTRLVKSFILIVGVCLASWNGVVLV